VEEETKLEGKLKTLVEAFKRANPDNDETEVEAMISLLEDYNWDIKAVDLTVKIIGSGPLMTFEDSDYFNRTWKKANQSELKAQLTENEKLDRVIELSKSDAFGCDHDQIKMIAETLQLSSPT
tara:strand:- start:6021 stop:6389 length:369 start_codon:yes stop_codon:yes gene_type:complete